MTAFEEWHKLRSSCCADCAKTCSHKMWEASAWNAALNEAKKVAEQFEILNPQNCVCKIAEAIEKLKEKA